MKKNEVQELLRANKIFNNHEITAKFGEKGVNDIWLQYYSYAPRSFSSGKTKVISPNYKTDPNTHWSNYGCKTFIGKKSQSMEEAMTWANEKYKVKEWKNSPFGGKIPDTVYARLQKFIKEQK